MKRAGKTIAIVIAVLVGTYVAVAVGYDLGKNEAQPVAKTAAQSPPTRAELLKLVNKERAKVGVKPLKEDARLDVSAQCKADDEVKYNYFGHMRNGEFVGQQCINETGIKCVLDSENLVTGDAAQIAVSAWMTSKSHRDAMLSSKYTLTGFGYGYVEHIPTTEIDPNAEGGSDIRDTYTIVEHFCQQ